MKYTKNNKKKNIITRKQKGGENKYIFKSNNITTQENKDSSYKEIGIIHITESGAINILRSAATGLFNIVGSKGFENIIYDETRNKALKKIHSQLSNNQKICNLKMEIENVSQSQLFFIHIYGTLLEKK
uniref:Uncharacterized protein n=1 Tax=Nucleocytoviricota sp. TaxID=2809609 RepID=A0A9E8G6F7_9VIRU|nr:hypothetical protein [Nucleocytoviricota sp.]UZT29129.1 hypothetical protein [Nucleocytoviricota sp.]